MRNKKLEILFNVLALVAVVCYIVFAFMVDNEAHREEVCSGIEIKIEDSLTIKLLNNNSVLAILDSAQLNPRGKLMDSLNVKEIEDKLKESCYVNNAEVYKVSGGVVVIEIMQVEPVLRVNMQSGYDFYLTKNRAIIKPVKRSAKNVIVVNGNYQFDFAVDYFGNIFQKNNEKECEKLEKLTNFVAIIENDDFLSSFIAQIWLDSEGDITLIPRISDQKIVFGSLFDMSEVDMSEVDMSEVDMNEVAMNKGLALVGESHERKLLKLKKFYTKSFKSGWWQSAETVDLRFAEQVIVK